MVASSKISLHQFDIAESVKKIGQLTPRLFDKFGNSIDGNHRTAFDSEWKSITLENIDTPEKLLLARFHANYHRRTMSDLEIKQTLNALLMLYSEQKTLDSGQAVQKPIIGRPSNELLHRAADALGVSYKTVSRYVEPEFKQKTPVKKKTSVKPEKPTKQVTIVETPNILAATFPNCKCKECIHNATCK